MSPIQSSSKLFNFMFLILSKGLHEVKNCKYTSYINNKYTEKNLKPKFQEWPKIL